MQITISQTSSQTLMVDLEQKKFPLTLRFRSLISFHVSFFFHRSFHILWDTVIHKKWRRKYSDFKTLDRNIHYNDLSRWILSYSKEKSIHSKVGKTIRNAKYLNISTSTFVNIANTSWELLSIWLKRFVHISLSIIFINVIGASVFSTVFLIS